MVKSLEEICEASYFTQRVVNVWNALPEEVVEAGTIGAFEGLLDKHMKM